MSQPWQIQNSLEDEHELNSFSERVARYEKLCTDTPLVIFEALQGARSGRNVPPSGGSDSLLGEPEPPEGAPTVHGGGDSTESRPLFPESNCCGARILGETFCAKCGEHCSER